MGDLPLFILFFLLVALLLRVDFIFYVVYVCLGVYAWSRWVTPRALRGLAVERQYQDHAFLGESVPVTVCLRNQQRWSLPWLYLAESIPPELRTGERETSQVISLRRREVAAFTYHVQAGRRGYYRLGPLRMTAGDLFGFAEQHAGLSPHYLTVYPRLIPIGRLGLPSRLPFGTVASQQRLFEDPARPVGVRDYHAGDSLRQMNWKVSAHAEKLLVKTFQPAISLETAVLLNLRLDDYANRYDGPEWAIEVAASLASHLISQRQAVGLMTNGTDPLQSITPVPQSAGLPAGNPADCVTVAQADGLPARNPADCVTVAQADGLPARNPADCVTVGQAIPPRPGRPHLMKILELLARVEAGETPPFHTWASTVCLNLSWGVTILVITPSAGEATCHTLHHLVRAGLNPVLLVIERSNHFGQLRERARRLGFRAYEVASERALKTL